LLCGIGGVLLGYVVSEAVGVEDTNGVDWLRWAIFIALAAVLVVADMTGSTPGSLPSGERAAVVGRGEGR